MSELRQNLITGDWVIIATERAKRPQEFVNAGPLPPALPSHRADCPFCPGNEKDNEPESCRLGDHRGWWVRSIPNKYPALSPIGSPTRKIEGIHHSMPGVGFHEVIIEHPRHDLTMALMEVGDIANILRIYRQRYGEIRQDPRIASIIIFKNHGEAAGTSLEHPHSQITATPIVPYQIRVRINEAIRYLDNTGNCLCCATLQDELAAKTRIIVEQEDFVAFIPYAAISPFHIWIFPRRHTSSFEAITDRELVNLADTLKIVLAKLYYGLHNPAYNYTIRSIPTGEQQAEHFHWYVAIVPRVTKAAGFEMGSGMYINTALPEESAKFLRDVNCPD